MVNISDNQWEVHFDALAENDFVVIDDFFSSSELTQLLTYFEQKSDQGVFQKAAIGSSGNELIINAIRGDYTYWLDRQQDRELEWLYDVLHDLRMRINRGCYLSLSDFEFHFAHYPPGGFYKKHLDQFAERNNRMISVVIYLNEQWNPGDGGELRVYPSGGVVQDIAPILNRCVLFRSDTLYHEVLLAQTSRKSLTGWMLYQPSVLASML
jgi:SM-20-related protein